MVPTMCTKTLPPTCLPLSPEHLSCFLLDSPLFPTMPHWKPSYCRFYEQPLTIYPLPACLSSAQDSPRGGSTFISIIPRPSLTYTRFRLQNISIKSRGTRSEWVAVVLTSSFAVCQRLSARKLLVINLKLLYGSQMRAFTLHLILATK